MGSRGGGVGTKEGCVEEDTKDWGDGEEDVPEASEIFDVAEEALTGYTNDGVAQVLDDFMRWIRCTELDEGNGAFILRGGRVGNGGGSAPPRVHIVRGMLIAGLPPRKRMFRLSGGSSLERSEVQLAWLPWQIQHSTTGSRSQNPTTHQSQSDTE